MQGGQLGLGEQGPFDNNNNNNDNDNDNDNNNNNKVHSVWIGPLAPHIHLFSPVQGQLPTEGTLTGKSVYLLDSLMEGLLLSWI
jgi:hypothetical protein